MKALLRFATLVVAILGGFGDVALAQQPITVPLALVDISTNDTADYKLGIWVGLGGGTPQLYEFDTGGKGMWASYDEHLDTGVEQWWGNYEDLHHDIHNTYSSGVTYHGKMVSTSVQIYGNLFAEGSAPGWGNSPGPLLVQSSGSLDIARIDTADGTEGWNANVKAGKPALQNRFFGDFGASLQVKADGSRQIFSVLPQLVPAGLTNGFIVSTGGAGNTTPQVQLGLTQTDVDSFPIQMDISAAYEGDYEGINTFAEALFEAMVSWSASTGESQTMENVPIVLDTGAPVTSIHEHGDLEVDSFFIVEDKNKNKFFGSGYSFEAISGGWSLTISPTGTTTNENKIAVRSGGDLGYMNTGIYTFTQFDVLFDLDNKILAFRPITVPEPSTLVLLSGSLLLGGMFLRRK